MPNILRRIVDMVLPGTLSDADMLVLRQDGVTGGRKLTLGALWTWIVAKATTNAPAVRTALGLGGMATQDASAVAISGGTAAGLTLSTATVWSLTSPLSIANGGTGAASASAGRAALGAAASGANTDLTSLGAVTSITASSNITIGPATSDGSDNRSVTIRAGGAADGTRGGYLNMSGCEAGGGVTLSSGDAGIVQVLAGTVDGSDNRLAALIGAGAAGSTRGAYVIAYGNEHATSPGRLVLQAGDTGDVRLGGAVLANSIAVIDASGLHQHRSYTVATLPTASPAGRSIYVSDGTSNKRFALSDGSAWRWPDGAIVS